MINYSRNEMGRGPSSPSGNGTVSRVNLFRCKESFLWQSGLFDSRRCVKMAQFDDVPRTFIQHKFVYNVSLISLEMQVSIFKDLMHQGYSGP